MLAGGPFGHEVIPLERRVQVAPDVADGRHVGPMIQNILGIRSGTRSVQVGIHRIVEPIAGDEREPPIVRKVQLTPSDTVRIAFPVPRFRSCP